MRRIFTDYPRVGSTTMLVQQLRSEGITTKSWTALSGKDRIGKLIDKGALYKILNNPLYIGEMRHQGACFPGEHEAIITRGQWEVVQTALASKPHGSKKGQIRQERPALLKGLIFTPDGRAMTPTSTNGSSGRTYRSATGMDELQVAVALGRIDLVWDQLFPLEQHRIVQLLVERIIVSPNEFQVKLHPNGVESLALDAMRNPGGSRAARQVEKASARGPTPSTSPATLCCCAPPTAA